MYYWSLTMIITLDFIWLNWYKSSFCPFTICTLFWQMKALWKHWIYRLSATVVAWSVLLLDCNMMKYRWFSVSIVAQWVYEESGAWLPAAPTATSGSPAKYVCNECGKVFSRNDSFAHHKTIHKGQSRCPICQKLFFRKYTMMSHLLIIHGIKYSSR